MTTSRRLLIFVGALVLLAVGGGLTSLIAAQGAGGIIPGLLETTTRAEGSVSQFGGNQGLWFFLLIVAIVFNLVGASLTGALIFWFLNRGIEESKAAEPANHETFADALPKLPQRNRQEDSSAGELPAGAEASN